MKLSQLQNNYSNHIVVIITDAFPLNVDLLVSPFLGNTIILFSIDTCNYNIIYKTYRFDCI